MKLFEINLNYIGCLFSNCILITDINNKSHPEASEKVGNY